MGLDKFGRASHSKSSVSRNLFPVKTIAFTEHGNIDCENLKICNLADPSVSTDAANRGYVDKRMIGFTPDGSIDCDGKRISNLANPIDGKNAVNKKHMDGEIRRVVKQNLDNYKVEEDKKLESIKKTLVDLKNGLQHFINETDDKIEGEHRKQFEINQTFLDFIKEQQEFRQSLENVIKDIKNDISVLVKTVAKFNVSH